jgi:uncharacterized protein (TIGR02266 family)
VQNSHSQLFDPRAIDSIPVPDLDRRRHPRFMLELAITMQGENNFYTGLSEDVSEGGIFIATHHLLPIGTVVVLSFTLPGASAPITVEGTVQWVRGPDATARAENVFGGDRRYAAGVTPGMGIRFCGVERASVAEIRAFMSKRRPDFYF